MPTVNKIAIHNNLNKNFRKTYTNSKFILNSRPQKVCNLCNLHKLHAVTLSQGNIGQAQIEPSTTRKGH